MEVAGSSAGPSAAPSAGSSSTTDLAPSVIARLKTALKERKFDYVLQESRRLLADFPGRVDLLSIAASAAYSKGEYEDARAFLSQALERQPDSKVLQESMDRVQKKLGGT